MKILCLLWGHDFQPAHDHPDGKMGYCIFECTRCENAVVSDPALGGQFPLLNTRGAIARDAAKAAQREHS